jgi:hypothetical protein
MEGRRLLTRPGPAVFSVVRGATRRRAAQRRIRPLTTLANRPNSALIVIDVQKGVVADAARRDAVVGTIGGLVDKARADGAPVVWVQHISQELVKGSDPWRIVPELSPREGEPVIEKTYGGRLRGDQPGGRCWPSGAWAGCW